MLPTVLHAGTPPAWWSARGVLTVGGTADYAAVNQGQVKNIARAAMNEMDAMLPQSAGTGIHGVVDAWSVPGFLPHDYSAMNLGQLKNLTKPFFDKLLSVGYQGPPLESGTYPWVSGTANDYSLANIGQVKNLFSFDVTYSSDPNNPLPDWWQMKYFGQLGNPAGADPDGDGMTNLQEYQQGTNPTDYGTGPNLSIINGASQTGAPGQVLAPLVVRVTDSSGNVLAYAPVQFSIRNGDASLSTTSSGGGGAVLRLLTGSDGLAQAYITLPSASGINTIVEATPFGTFQNNTKVTFNELSVSQTLNALSHEYDPIGQLLNTTQPNGSLIQFGYDPNGNVLSITQ